MADKVAAGSTILLLKELLKKENYVEILPQFIEAIHAVEFGLLDKDITILTNLGIDRNGLAQVINIGHFHGQFCRLIFNCCADVVEKGRIKDIPWILLFKTILNNINGFSILNLMDNFTARDSHTKVQVKIAECFQYAIENDYLFTIMWKQCLEKPVSSINDKHVYSPTIQMHWDQLIQCLISLPDKISNQLELKTSSVFQPVAYFTKLARNISDVLIKIYKSLQSSQDCSLAFVSQLFGKICATGKAGIMLDVLIPFMVKWVKETPLWCRICSKLLLSVPDPLLESCVEPLIKKAQSADLLSSLLNDAVLSRPKLKFLLTHKFLFTKTYEDDGISLCILGYLSGKISMESCFKQTLFKLLEVWGEKSSIKHTSFEQHLYISKCLLIALSCLNQSQKKAWKSELILKMMEAVPAHLESPNEKLHQIGMIVAECLTSIVDKDGKKLHFELERDDQIDYLFKLSVNPSEAIRQNKEKEKENKICDKEVHLNKEDIPFENKEDIPLENKSVLNEQKSRNEGEELDSDDDLEPFNLEEEEGSSSVNGVRSPVYLRDCMAGLLTSKDPNRLEASLRVLQKVVMKEPGDLPDVCVELVKILLHLTNEYSIVNFVAMRRDSMIEITVKCPAQVAQYLAEQFYHENYSLMQRCDILEVISNAAVRLSTPLPENHPDELRSHLPLPNIPGIPSDIEKPKWQAIIDERVKKKTRRFTKGPTQELPSPKKNRFTQVAGLFFFPLLKKFGMSLTTCNMFGTDCFILGKFIYTLGIILQSADGLPIVVLMGKSLFDLIWSLRYHKEAYVRQSLIYATTMITLHVPSFSLITDLQSEIFEARDWLKELLQSDPNVECKKLAGSCLVLMQRVMQQELIGNVS